MQKDSILNIILVGVGLCIVCGAVISTVAVSLRDQQEQNVIFDQQSKIKWACLFCARKKD